MLPNKRRAFSLIELMVVIAVIGILAAVAVPSYRDYIIRSKISEVISLANADLKKVAEYISLNGMPASSSDGENIDEFIDNYAVAGSPYVSATSFGSTGLSITISTGGALPSGNSLILLFFPEIENNTLIWQCGYDEDSTDGAEAYLPSNCQNTISGSLWASS